MYLTLRDSYRRVLLSFKVILYLFNGVAPVTMNVYILSNYVRHVWWHGSLTLLPIKLRGELPCIRVKLCDSIIDCFVRQLHLFRQLLSWNSVAMIAIGDGLFS